VENTCARFVLVGLANSLTGYSVILFFQFVVGLSAVVSNACGYLLGMVLSYLLNRRFTFNTRRNHRSGIPLFLAAAALSYLANLLVLSAFVRLVPTIAPALAQALAVGSYSVSFYLLSRHVVFKRA
jgi:putative flippase GtrA